MKTIIKEYLDNKAASDPLFAKTYSKPNKSIDECCNYIMQQMAKRNGYTISGGKCVALKDEEMFSLAVHYYDEDDIKNIKSVTNVRVTTSKSAPLVKLTEDEKKEAKRRAIEELKNQEKAKLEAVAKKAEEARKKKLQEKREKQEVFQPSLFD